MTDRLPPIDWDEPTKYTGISRRNNVKGYIASLSLLGKQYHFGPFFSSQLEAATAYDRLVKFFIAYTKPKPRINMPYESWSLLDDAQTVDELGVRLVNLRAKLNADAKLQGLDAEAESAKRIEHLSITCSLASYYATDDKERRCITKLNALYAIRARAADQSVRAHVVVNNVTMGKEKRNKAVCIMESFQEHHLEYLRCFDRTICELLRVMSPDSTTEEL